MAINILIIDDSSTMRKIIRRCVMETGLDFGLLDEATDGLEGLDLVAEQTYDFVLTDWNMPKMNGLEFVQNLRKTNQITKVIMITTEVAEKEIEKAKASQVDEYITKPFEPSKLRQKMERLLG